MTSALQNVRRHIQPGYTKAAPTRSTVDQHQQSAYDLLRQTLNDWGLGDLFKYAKQFATQGLSGDEITLKLQQTDEYKTRFAGNDLRKAAGLSTLSPAQYIALEEQYRQVLTQYGLPSGFYDSHADFNKFIGGDVSPAELQARAAVASQQYLMAPQEFRDYWANYGLTPGDAVASILDPHHESLASLQDKANAVAVGGSALQQGINVTAQRATDLARNGVTLAQARAAYQRIAAHGQTDASIASRFGTTFDQTDEENDLLLSNGEAARKRNLLYSEEAAQFGGHAGASTQSLSASANY